MTASSCGRSVIPTTHDVPADQALKPLQAAAMVAPGCRWRTRLLALVCASHDGRPEHLRRIEAILAASGSARPTSRTRRPCRSTSTPKRTPVQTGVRPARDPAELRRKARRHARHSRHQRLGDGRLLSGRPPVPAGDRQSRCERSRSRPVDHVGVDRVRCAAPTVSLIGLRRRRPSPRRSRSRRPPGHELGTPRWSSRPTPT